MSSKISRNKMTTIILVLLIVGSVLFVWAWARQSNINIKHHSEIDRQHLIQSQIASCERVNKLRKQFNIRGVAMQNYVTSEIKLDRILLTVTNKTEQEKNVIRKDIATLYRIGRAYHTVATVNCPKIVRASTG